MLRDTKPIRPSPGFRSKAEILLWLRTHSSLTIPEMHVVTLAAWREDPARELAALRARLTASRLAVRSNCSREDTAESSGAGVFTSCLNVPRDDVRLAEAVEAVFTSYGPEVDPAESVFVQPMVENIVASGVIMTKGLPEWAPYYVVNYDDESGRTDTVTGGTGASKTVFVYNHARRDHFVSAQLHAFVAFARMVETACGSEALDIEFALDRNDVIHLLQVRPIAARPPRHGDVRDCVHTRIRQLENFLDTCMRPHPYLYGPSTILGVMPDWNPAEMLGVTPRPLAASLYRELITRRVWSLARERMGYRAMPPEELMVLISGRPYIDVRLSYNSFLPEGLDPATGERMVSAWLDRLRDNPALHDKIEFEVALTVLDFMFDATLEERYPGLLDAAERERFRERLAGLTRRNLDLSPEGTLGRAEADIAELEARQRARRGSAMIQDYAARIRCLAEECRILGTLPFSILARHAFMAESLLKSAVARGVLSPERCRAFKASVETISGQLGRDFKATIDGRMGRANFLAEYGHLRPSSYDILSARYADRADLFDTAAMPLSEHGEVRFSLTGEERAALAALLDEAGLGITPDGMLDHARRAIAGREYGKFVFTRSLSDILELIARWGTDRELSRDDLSYLNLDHVFDRSAANILTSMDDLLREAVGKGRRIFELGRNLRLGYLIRSSGDLYVVPQNRSTPNFVGSGRVEGAVIRLSAHSGCAVDISGKVVCIENADPGFDWIFTRKIAGLVTRFGGANSHMAIRCAEYGLPAAIGVGERLYETISSSGRCLLDAGGNTLVPL